MEPDEEQEPTLPAEEEPASPSSASPEPDEAQEPALPSEAAAAEPSVDSPSVPLMALQRRGPSRRVFSWGAAIAAVLIIALITTTLLISHAASPGSTGKGHATPGPKPPPLSVYGLASPPGNWSGTIRPVGTEGATPSYMPTPAAPTNGTVFALNAANGSPRWQHTLPGTVGTSQAVAGDALYIGSSDGNVSAFDASTGKLLWSARLLQESEVWQVVDGIVYATSFDEPPSGQERIYALDARNGKQLWQSTMEAGIDLIADGTVYVRTSSGSPSQLTGTVSALDARTGTERWHFQGQGFLSTQSVSGGQVYVIGTQYQTENIGNSPYPLLIAQDTLYVLDASTGTQRWSYPKNPASSLSLAGTENGAVYLLTNASVPPRNLVPDVLSALSAADGSVQWQKEIPQVESTSGGTINVFFGPFNSSGAMLSNGVIYLGGLTDPLSAYRASDGSLLWSNTQLWPTTTLPEEDPTVERVVDGVVYVLNQTLAQEPGLYALDASTGKLLWKQAGEELSINSVVNGVVYVSTSDLGPLAPSVTEGDISALDASTGTVRWTYSLGKETVSITVQ